MLYFLVEFLHALGITSPGGRGWPTVVFAFLLAGFGTWAFVPRLTAYSLGVGWSEEAKTDPSHRPPVTNAGGLAIFAGVIVALIAAALLRQTLLEAVQVQILAILLGGSLLILSGFMGDQFGFPLAVRLGTQTVAALLAAASTGIRIHITFGGPVASTLSILLTVIWVLIITNAMGLIDDVDGLASGIAGGITALSTVAVRHNSRTWRLRPYCWRHSAGPLSAF